jgi:Flp pilus assembly protein TadG
MMAQILPPHRQDVSPLPHRRRRFPHCESGAAMLEFAIVLPILVLMFLALVEFTDAFSVRRRVEATATMVADLVSQSASVSSADLGDISRIGDALMRPYPGAPLGLRITSVGHDRNNDTVVAWSWGNAKMAALQEGAHIDVPANLLDAQTGLIVAETIYEFHPAVGTYLLDGRTFTAKAYYRPRLGAAVDLVN